MFSAADAATSTAGCKVHGSARTLIEPALDSGTIVYDPCTRGPCFQGRCLILARLDCCQTGVVLATGEYCPPELAADRSVCGDFGDGDGELDFDDAMESTGCVADAGPLQPDCFVFDFNRDGRIDLLDVGFSDLADVASVTRCGIEQGSAASTASLGFCDPRLPVILNDVDGSSGSNESTRE